MFLAWVAIVSLLLPQLQPAQSTKAKVELARNRVLTNAFALGPWRAFLATLPRYGGLFVVEGDILMTEDQLRNYIVAQAGGGRPAAPGAELIVAVSNGKLDYWVSPEQRHIHYVIDRASFTQDEATEIANNLKSATADWVRTCDACAITFVEDMQPVQPAGSPPRFVVRLVNSNNSYIAASFFPSYPQDRYYLHIDRSYFTTRFDHVGVLRHELGHILGYRHEHIRGIPGCYMEGGQWMPLTPYDPQSVMHYFCGGAGSITLAITQTDVDGHRSLYAGH